MSDANIHFIKDEQTMSIIAAILNIAGPNYNIPYDSLGQPTIANDRNNDELLQFALPGGTSIKGYADTSLSESMGTAINSMLAVLAPFISAYGLILPILGVIRGIIEVLCAMPNPFAVIRAIIRLFKKWIPAFITLFPPLAGVLIIIGVIKTIIAIVLYIMTVVVPTIQLIIANIKFMAKAFDDGAPEEARKAATEKLLDMLIEFLNQTGVLGVLLPLLEIISTILNLVSGKPCRKGRSKVPDCSKSSMVKIKDEFSCDDNDSSCCDNKVCPPELQRHAIMGRGMLMPSIFGEAPPLFVYKLYTNHSLTRKLKKYNHNLSDQLNQQLDEEIDDSCPPGSDDDDCPNLRVTITSRRGGARKTTKAIAKVRGNVITIISPSLFTMIGSVDFEVKPNYEALVYRNAIGLACHPDVEEVKEQLGERYAAIEVSVADRFPAAMDAIDQYRNLNSDFSALLSELSGKVNEVVAKDPPYDSDIDDITSIQNRMLSTFNDFLNNMYNTLNTILAGSVSKFDSDLSVDKTIVKANGEDKATLSVIPRDITGAPLAQNLPNGVGISVTFFTDFGVISNQRTNGATGEILADIASASTGMATITAKINSDFISELVDGNEVVSSVKVNFIGDAILPQRRLVTTPDSNTKSQTGIAAERETRGK